MLSHTHLKNQVMVNIMDTYLDLRSVVSLSNSRIPTYLAIVLLADDRYKIVAIANHIKDLTIVIDRLHAKAYADNPHNQLPKVVIETKTNAKRMYGISL